MTNVLWIVADDMRYDHLPYAPYINGTLRRLGTEFTACRLNVPVCQGARAGFVTGQYGLRAGNGVYQNDEGDVTDSTNDALAVWLDTAGVECAFFGKYLLGVSNGAVESGWSHWRQLTFGTAQLRYGYEIYDGTSDSNPDGHATHYLRDEVVSYLGSATEPWLAWLCFTDPHALGSPTFDHAPTPARMEELSWLDWDFTFLDDTTDKPTYIANRTKPEASPAWRAQIRRQIRQVRDVDAAIETIMGSIDLSDTIVIFTSDGGVHYGEQNVQQGTTRKDQPHDPSALVPLVCAGPGFGAGRTVAVPTTGQDVVATVVEEQSATATLTLDGTNLVTIAADPASYTDRGTLYERKNHGSDPDAEGIFKRTRKLIRYPGETGDDKYEAYDLDTDPDEHLNWANDAGRSAERDTLESELDALIGA